MRIIEREVVEYLEYCEKIRGMSNATMLMKRNILGRFIRTVSVGAMEDLSNEEFGKWMRQEMERGISMQSMNMYNSVVVAMVRYFQDTGVYVPLNLNLVRKMKGAASRRKFYTYDEILQVVEAVDEGYFGDEFDNCGAGCSEIGLMVLIMFETGMRIAELVRLKTSEISGRRIDFVGKGKKPREVYMTLDTAQKVYEFLDGREGYVWGGLSLNGEPPTVNTVRQRMVLAFEAAGFEGFYPHALRHSFATNLQRKGASVAEIKEMMGHSSIATTERYLHGFEGRMEELFDKYQ